MKLRKIVAVILALCMVFALAACDKDRDIKKEQEELQNSLNATPAPAEAAPVGEDGEPAGEPAAEPVVMPTVTSDDVELYVSKDVRGDMHVVNAFGQQSALYIVDEDGNIKDMGGNFVVAAENVKQFGEVSKIQFSAHEYAATLRAEEEVSENDANVTNIRQRPVNITVLLSANVEGATNRIVILEMQNTKIAEVRANANAKILADGAFNVNANQIAIELSENGTARITVTAITAGNTELLAYTLSGKSDAHCEIVVEDGRTQSPAEIDANTNINEVVIASDDPTVHTHSYTRTVVPPTQYEKGYTEYTCACGHSYRDEYTSPLPAQEPEPEVHVHQYTASVVAPTATERGYTLHVCECGDSYKDSFVAPTGQD